MIDLQQAARDHLWLHFTRMGGYRDAEVPIIVRGDGCCLEDSNGKRYLDALAGLFCVNIGYGGDAVIQISPPMVAGQAEFDEMTGILGDLLVEAWHGLECRRNVDVVDGV